MATLATLMPESFHQRLRRLRLEAGLSQADLGAAIGVGQTKISDFEKHLEPRAREAISLARFFDISVEDLVGEAEAALDEADDAASKGEDEPRQAGRWPRRLPPRRLRRGVATRAAW